MAMTSQQVLTELEKLLRQYFPDDIGAPNSSWTQDNYKLDLYRLAQRAYKIVPADRVRMFFADDWSKCPERQLSDEDRIQLDRIADAWDAWQFGMLVDSGYYD